MLTSQSVVHTTPSPHSLMLLPLFPVHYTSTTNEGRLYRLKQLTASLVLGHQDLHVCKSFVAGMLSAPLISILGLLRVTNLLLTYLLTYLLLRKLSQNTQSWLPFLQRQKMLHSVTIRTSDL